MEITGGRPGSIGVEGNPAAAVGHQLAGKSYPVEAPTGAHSVRADWEAKARGATPDRAGEARRTL